MGESLLDIIYSPRYNYDCIIIYKWVRAPVFERVVLLKKKFVGFLLVMALIACLILPVSAVQTPMLSLSAGTVRAGGTVDLTISIQENPGFSAVKLFVYYDTSVFTINPASGVQPVGKFGETGAIMGNTIQLAKENGRYDGVPDKDGIIVLWYNAMGVNTDGDGQMLKLKLHASEDAVNGDHTVSIGYSHQDTTTETGDKVAFQTGSAKVTVTGGADGEIVEEPVKEPVEFTDVTGHWAESFIRQSAAIGLVEGYQGKYRPNDTMTRAEFVTILWRSQGEPAPKAKASFTDLTQDWYRDAVAWAEENAVVNGIGNGKFGPNAPVTREQLVTILHRLAGSPMGMELMLAGPYDDQYPDSGRIGDWAKPALYWSIYKGIYCGEHSADIGSQLAPKANADRAQIAVMMVRYLNQVTE